MSPPRLWTVSADLPERIPYARTPRKLPVVLAAEEVVRFLEAVPSLKARAALTTPYATGLRDAETAGIKVADIDSNRMIIRVEQGKGDADHSFHVPVRSGKTDQQVMREMLDVMAGWISRLNS